MSNPTVEYNEVHQLEYKLKNQWITLNDPTASIREQEIIIGFIECLEQMLLNLKDKRYEEKVICK